VSVSVLLVDDDPSFRAVAARMLSSWGHDVEEAECWEEGLARSGTLRPDVVLVDVGLPDGDGLQLAERIAAMAWHPRVIIVSSDADVTDGDTAVRLGAVAFIPKEQFADGRLQALVEPPPGG
jgi:CheY-like chemotaxis protein